MISCLLCSTPPLSVCCLIAPDISPTTVECEVTQSCVYRECRRGLSTQPCTPVLRVRLGEKWRPSLTPWGLLVRKSLIHIHRGLVRPSSRCLITNLLGTIVLILCCSPQAAWFSNCCESQRILLVSGFQGLTQIPSFWSRYRLYWMTAVKMQICKSVCEIIRFWQSCLMGCWVYLYTSL